MAITWTAYYLNDLEQIANSLINQFPQGKFALYGELGAGKTAFVKSFGKLLNIEEDIASPSFSILNEYQTPDGNFYHLDFYRLSTAEEIFDLGYEEYIHDHAWIFIEWPELIEDLLPREFVKITIQVDELGQRHFVINQ